MKRFFSLFLYLMLSNTVISSPYERAGELSQILDSYDMKKVSDFYQNNSLTQDEHTTILHLITSGFIFTDAPDIHKDEFVYQLTLYVLNHANFKDKDLLGACSNCILSRNTGALKALLHSGKVKESILCERIMFMDGLQYPTLLGLAFLLNREEYAAMLVKHGACFPKEEMARIKAAQLKWDHLSPEQKKVWKALLSL